MTNHKHWGVSTVVLINGIISTIVFLYLISLTVLEIQSFYIDTPPFLQAIEWGDVKALKHIIDNGGDVNGKIGNKTVLTSTMKYMDHSANPLWALGEEKLKEELERRNKVRMKMIEVLLDNGADINLLDENGWNLLHYVVDRYIDLNSKVDLVEMLLKRGADINILNGDRKSPLKIALNKGFQEIADILKQHGATK